MLAISDYPVHEFAKLLHPYGLRYGFLVPTETGLRKSIMDSTIALREVMAAVGFHDFDNQLQGPSHKVIQSGEYWQGDSPIEFQISLYRPKSKEGDPRIWPRGLKKLLQPGNLLALIPESKKILILNGSSPALRQALTDSESDLSQRLSEIEQCESAIFESLLLCLKAISNKGWIPTVNPGADSGVGMTLESELNINPNSSPTPDFEGIEIKACRKTTASQRSGRCNLFCCVPDWTKSRCKSSKDFLDAHGRVREDSRRKLYHTIRTGKPNSYGLQLDLLTHEKFSSAPILQVFHRKHQADPKRIELQWDVSLLIQKLIDKHSETAWVHAETRVSGGIEEFQYCSLDYTRGPDPDIFIDLIRNSRVSLEITIAETSDGRVRDKGYIFKVDAGARDILFSRKKHFSLL